MEAADIILRPVITEKSSFLREDSPVCKRKTYTFKVSDRSNKVEIMKAIEKMFGVKPESCSIVNVRGKKKANVPYKGSVKKGHGLTSSWKKAYVSLPEGKTIAELEA